MPCSTISRHSNFRNHGKTKVTKYSNQSPQHLLCVIHDVVTSLSRLSTAMIFYKRNRRQEHHSTSVGQSVRTFWRQGMSVQLVVPCILSQRVSRAGTGCHLFVVEKRSLFLVNFFHILFRCSGNDNPREGSVLFQGCHLNFNFIRFQIIRDSGPPLYVFGSNQPEQKASSSRGHRHAPAPPKCPDHRHETSRKMCLTPVSPA